MKRLSGLEQNQADKEINILIKKINNTSIKKQYNIKIKLLKYLKKSDGFLQVNYFNKRPVYEWVNFRQYEV